MKNKSFTGGVIARNTEKNNLVNMNVRKIVKIIKT